MGIKPGFYVIRLVQAEMILKRQVIWQLSSVSVHLLNNSHGADSNYRRIFVGATFSLANDLQTTCSTVHWESDVMLRWINIKWKIDNMTPMWRFPATSALNVEICLVTWNSKPNLRFDHQNRHNMGSLELSRCWNSQKVVWQILELRGPGYWVTTYRHKDIFITPTISENFLAYWSCNSLLNILFCVDKINFCLRMSSIGGNFLFCNEVDVNRELVSGAHVSLT